MSFRGTALLLLLTVLVTLARGAKLNIDATRDCDCKVVSCCTTKNIYLELMAVYPGSQREEDRKHIQFWSGEYGFKTWARLGEERPDPWVISPLIK